jgi:formyltetrahydrofolate deformylase
MRTACDGPLDGEAVRAEVAGLLPPGAPCRSGGAPRRIVVLASREHHCLADLLVRNEYGELGAELLAVVSNHDNLRPLVAEKFSVPFHHVSHENLTREAHEEALQALIEPLRPDYIVLAKYMRILWTRDRRRVAEPDRQHPPFVSFPPLSAPGRTTRPFSGGSR